MSHPSVLFVSGIDTNIGKSYATAMLLDRLRAQGVKAISQKMIQTGCYTTSEDIELHRHLLGEPLCPADLDGTTAPIILSYPASPHLAARLDGTSIDLEVLDRATQHLLEGYGYECVVLEGAGGLMVPITETYLTADFIADRGYPLALVSSGRLGSINHTLLSLEVCRLRGIELRYLIYNRYPSTDSLIEDDTRHYLQCYLERYHPTALLLELDTWR